MTNAERLAEIISSERYEFWIKENEPMDNGYKYGIVRDMKSGQIVGFNLSPRVHVIFDEKDIEDALKEKAKEKFFKAMQNEMEAIKNENGD